MPPRLHGERSIRRASMSLQSLSGVRLHRPFRENPGGARRCVPEAQGSPQAEGHALSLVAEEQEDGNRPRAAEGHRDRLQSRACREQDTERGRHVVRNEVHAPQEGQSVQQQLWAASAPGAESMLWKRRSSHRLSDRPATHRWIACVHELPPGYISPGRSFSPYSPLS